jgi:hypothetical protein
MQVSSESLFHFTSSMKNIVSILTKRFHLTYCKEEIYFGKESNIEYYPMITFCDLPIGLIKGHIEKYGSYGIGMTKEWGIKNGLNPVLYIEKDSILTDDIGSTLDNISTVFNLFKQIRQDPSFKENEVIIKILENHSQNAEKYLNILRFVKNYSGELVRKNKVYKNYKFYDEKEWRYVPKYSDEKIKQSLHEKDYNEYRGKSFEKPLIESCKLDFDSNDIKYLIVRSDKDIPKLIRTIKSIDNLSKNSNEYDILTTKIMTVDQIKKDF